MPSRGPQEELARLLVGIGRQLRSAVHLQERSPGQHLPPHRKRLDDGHAAAEPDRVFPRRHDELDATRHDAAALVARVEGSLHGEGDVAEPARPGPVRTLLKVDGGDDLQLRSRADSSLVDEVVAHRRFRATGDSGHPERFVLRKRLLGEHALEAG